MVTVQFADDRVTERIESLDVSLFDNIRTQSTTEDRRGWLAVQRAMRRPHGYTYLEIGSHLGGSLQQHLPDPLCVGIGSIDKRPFVQEDDRGARYQYDGNSTAQMLENLRGVAPAEMPKLACFEGDAREIGDYGLTAPPDICFIDGEHTISATLSDFDFCLRVCAPNAAICFHDDYVVAPALETVVARLREQGISFTARKIAGYTFAIFLRDCPAGRDPYIVSHSTDGNRWLLRQRLRRLVLPIWLDNREIRRLATDWLRPTVRRAVQLCRLVLCL